MVQPKRPLRVPVRPQPSPQGVQQEGGGRAKTEQVEMVDLQEQSYIKTLIRDVPDFPQEGILFRDITPLLADPRGFHIVLDALSQPFIGTPIDAIVGVESRGFIFGAAMAVRLNVSFVPVRKPGKLPAATDTVSYSLEYGEAELQMHHDALEEGAQVLVVDDLLATGGTAAAAASLIKGQGASVSAFAFAIELSGLGGRARLGDAPIVSILQYE